MGSVKEEEDEEYVNDRSKKTTVFNNFFDNSEKTGDALFKISKQRHNSLTNIPLLTFSLIGNSIVFA